MGCSISLGLQHEITPPLLLFGKKRSGPMQIVNKLIIATSPPLLLTTILKWTLILISTNNNLNLSWF